MSAAGLVKFGICIFLAAAWWMFLAPVVDSFSFMEPIGQFITQQRLDTQYALTMGFKVSPVLVLLAIGLQLWAQSLQRSGDRVRISGEVATITGVYVTQITLILLCISVGPAIDAISAGIMEMPAVSPLIPMDMMYLVMSWFYPLLVLMMVVAYVVLFISIAKDLDYQFKSIGKQANSASNMWNR